MLYIRLRDYIETQPGCDFQSLMDFSGCSAADVASALSFLIDYKFVSKRDNKYFFIAKQNDVIKTELNEIQVSAVRYAKRILRDGTLLHKVCLYLIEKNPGGIRSQTLEKICNTSQSNLDYAGKKLALSGLVRIELAPNKTTKSLDRVYFPINSA